MSLSLKNVALIIKILEPFKFATEEICGEKHVLMSLLYPVFVSIKYHLNECEKKPNMAIIRAKFSK